MGRSSSLIDDINTINPGDIPCRCNQRRQSSYKRNISDFIIMYNVTVFVIIVSCTHTLCLADLSFRKPSANWDMDDVHIDSENDNNCKDNGEYLDGYSLSGGTKAGRYVNMGTVKNISDCSNLCCQQKDCSLAIMLLYPKLNSRSCFNVHCYDEYNSFGCKPVISEKSRYHPYIFKKHDVEIPTSKDEEKGICRPYSGTVCANNVDRSKLYYYSTHNASTLDKRLRAPIRQLSSRLSDWCSRLALQAICYRFYPQCLDTNDPKPISICNDYCDKLINGVCAREFESANMVSYLKRVIPGCDNSNSSVNLPIMDCVKLSVELPSSEGSGNSDDVEKMINERSEQSSEVDNDPDPKDAMNDTPLDHSSHHNVSSQTSLPPSTPSTLPNLVTSRISVVPTQSAKSRVSKATVTTTTSTHSSPKVTTQHMKPTTKIVHKSSSSITTTTKTAISTDVPTTILKTNGSTVTIVDVKSVDATETSLKVATDVTSPPPTPPVDQEIRVSAGDNTEITLPENHVSLFASTWPKEKNVGDYTYKWTQISSPVKSHGYIEGTTSKNVKLTNLDVVGVYTFKLDVASSQNKGRHGVGFVNITVKKPTRVNHPPRAEITQKETVIQLPTNTVILDASKSTDDDKIVSYKWEELKGPIKEKSFFASSIDTQILQLKNLVAGEYKFRLTVTDSDGETDTTEATVIVKKEPDYPPKANAGNDIVIRLPNNSVILDGNKSTDDKGTLKYQWSKTPDSPTCDMQGTDKSQLKLSRLQEGSYVFQLMVTDTSGQTSEAKVKVVVLPEKNTAPVAVAGDDKEIIYPDDSTTLDGSKSNDNSKIVSFHWEQISGPNKAKLKGPSDKKVHLSDLIVGIYVLKLTVVDDKNLVGTDTVKVYVKKDHNEHPLAVAGKPTIVYLPTRSVVLDGSKSHDDEMIDQYLWSRAGLSPAAGVVVNGSDHKAILHLTNLVKGRYIFDLTVTDNKGLTGTDSVTVQVLENPNSLGLVELFLYLDIDNFSEENKKQLIRKLSVILEVGKEFVNVEEISGATYGKGVMILFYVKDSATGRILDGKYVADLLKQKVGFGGKLFEYTMQRVEPYICRNNCSEHGYCDKSTKLCVCDSFWTANFLKSKFGDKESNCDWSILYLSVAVFGLFLILIGVAWAVCFCFARKKRNKRRARYRALRTTDPDTKEEILLIPKGMKAKFSANSLTFTESDEDSEQETTVFDKKKLVNGHVRMNGTVNGSVSKYLEKDF